MGEVGETRQLNLSPKAKYFYRRLVKSTITLSQCQRRINSYQQRLANAERFAKSKKFQNMMAYVNTCTYKFMLCQIRNKKRSPKGRRFTLDEQILVLTLLKASGKGYRLLSSILALPSKRTLANLLSKLPLSAGVNTKIFNALKENVAKMKPLDRHCALIFDEMSISVNLQYNSKEDCIDGIENYGDQRKPALADHVNVFMLKGIFRGWKQPIAFTFSNGPVKSYILKQKIR